MATKEAKNRAQSDEIQPSEIIPLSWEFGADMGSAEEITDKAVVATDKSDDVDVTLTIVKASSIQNGDQTNSKVQVVLHDMTAGKDYNIQILATISANKVLEADIEVPCRSST